MGVHMRYEFKFTPEFWWAIFTVIIGSLGTAVATQGALPPTDVKTWLLAAIFAMIRPLFGLLLSLRGPDDGSGKTMDPYGYQA